MLDVRRYVTELCYRRFGLKKRQMPKEPKNFRDWSETSRERWQRQQEEKMKQQEKCDELFIADETRVLNDLCRQIVFLIDRANAAEPVYLCECDALRMMQDEAIGLCSNLKRELNYIADTIPGNRNFLAVLTEEIDREIAILRGWRKSCNHLRDEATVREIKRRKSAAERAGFVLTASGLREKNETTGSI